MYKNCKKKKKSNSCETNSLEFLLSLSRLITIIIFFSFSIFESTTSLNDFNDNLLSIEKYIRVPERKKERKRKEKKKKKRWYEF